MGVNLHQSYYPKTSFLDSMRNPIFRLYELYEPHAKLEHQKNSQFNGELFISLISFFSERDFISISFGKFYFPFMWVQKIYDITQYQIEWKGDYNAIVFQYGIQARILKWFYLEFPLGIGYMPEVRFFYQSWRLQSLGFLDPITFHQNSFFSGEGLLWRINGNLVYRHQQWSIKLGMSYHYGISSRMTSKNQNQNWYWIQRKYIWITDDISYYFKYQQEYLETFYYVLRNFPLLEEVKPIWSMVSIQLGFGFRM
ncbi:MAG: hypothetical protein RMI35_02815 [Leptospiraceae bacterium]|nr:hypothetical protein [Leptospiraceae bacterium]